MTAASHGDGRFTPEQWQRMQDEDRQALLSVMGILNGILVLACLGYAAVVLGIVLNNQTAGLGVLLAGGAGLILYVGYAWFKVRAKVAASTPVISQSVGTPMALSRVTKPEALVHG
jgi:hypothetical protein